MGQQEQIDWIGKVVQVELKETKGKRKQTQGRVRWKWGAAEPFKMSALWRKWATEEIDDAAGSGVSVHNRKTAHMGSGEYNVETGKIGTGKNI